MKRRDFFRKGVVGAVGASMVPSIAKADTKADDLGTRDKDKWTNLGTGKVGIPNRKRSIKCDVAVMGGGLAGICAAVSAARNGSKVTLVQDRPVLGGNASSEMRVHVNGVNHLKPDNKAERETGIIEEILLHNRFLNKQESFPMFDHVMYDFVTREPNIELLLNTQAVEPIMSGNTIKAARCWQLTTETEITVNAQMFIDCSGDGLLAAAAGAEYRTGREGRDEFNEKYAPEKPDGWQMGATLLLSAKDMGKPTPYEAPHFAIKYKAEESHPKRKFKGFKDGIWWIEIGSDNDIIADQEINRHKLMGYLHGVWDYIKNSGNFPEADNLALDWLGSLPSKRESRRFIGDYILSEKDLTEHRHFSDAVAFGGWSLDEHCWAGIENLQDPPSYFHYHFKKVYEIPYRSLYSKNITNLLFAGRNISQTHIALSSSRVMSTCSLMGQAAGTAANLCVQKGVNPRDISQKYINELQENLMRDDAFIPNRPSKDSKDLAKKASQIFASSTQSGDANLVIDGMSRDFNGKVHHWQSSGLPAHLQMEWKKPVKISKVEVKCDTNLQRNILMRKDSKVSHNFWNDVPHELLKTISVEARVKGKWVKVGATDNNRTRLIKFNFDSVETTAIRLVLQETYGVPDPKLYEVRAYEG
ncbi:FAD-dependent oxidoreductase [Saccharicrinis aurantiacus]|uniref:FAD-dependent oxidoreductase n=1 Tax=Saccharicrinis aurantiacus TaxID=1849719 RepID=UPI00094FE936|nr:FAD-dependent oxidoreductase [Saccharicrinis aurantiacus]